MVPDQPDAAIEVVVREAEGFDAFVAASSPRLMRAAVLLTGDHGRAEDLVQDALARTFLRWNHIAREDPMAYVRRSMFNGYVDWWRRRPWREQPTAVLPDEPGHETDSTDRHAATDALLRALSALTRRERAVIVLRYLEDLSERQIAEALSIAPGTVKSASVRALAKLRTSPHLGRDDFGVTVAPWKGYPVSTDDWLTDAMTDYAAAPMRGVTSTVVRRRAAFIRRTRRVLAVTGFVGVFAGVAMAWSVGSPGSASQSPLGPATTVPGQARCADHGGPSPTPPAAPPKSSASDSAEATSDGHATSEGRGWQGRAAAYTDGLFSLAAAHCSYTGGRFDNRTHTVIVEGVGEPASDVAAKIAAAPPSITARWLAVPFTEAQINEAMNQASTYKLYAGAHEREPVIDGIVAYVKLDGHETRAEAIAGVRAAVTNGVTVYVRIGAIRLIPQ